MEGSNRGSCRSSACRVLLEYGRNAITVDDNLGGARDGRTGDQQWSFGVCLAEGEQQLQDHFDCGPE
jgi:hypothetical protein